MKKFYLMIMLLLFATANLVAQNPNNHWQLGNSDVNFSTNPPTVSNAGNVNQYGNASISDDNGNILFYTNGQTVWNKNHGIIPESNGAINYNFTPNYDSFQSVIIVPQINTPNYYIIRASLDQTLSGSFSYRFHRYEYAIVDFTNNNLGELKDLRELPTQAPNNWRNLYNYPSPDAEGIGHGNPLTAVKMNNADGLWIIINLDDKIHSIALTNSGLAEPVISQLNFTVVNQKAIYKFTPNNSKMGIYESGGQNESTNGKFYMIDFDNATGIFSNQVRINFSNIYNEVWCDTFAFSSDSQKVFFVNGSELSVKELLNPNSIVRNIATMPLKSQQLNYARYRWNLQMDKNGEILLLGNELNYVKRILNQDSYSSSSLSPTFLTLNNNFFFPNSPYYAFPNLPQLIPSFLPPCPTTQTLSLNVTNGIDKKQASQTITASNTISFGVGVIYHAPTVILKPSFNAKAGSTVHIYSAGCTNTFLARQSHNQTAINKDDYQNEKDIYVKLINVINISPNPSNGIFKISLNEISEGKIEVSDLYGFTIYKSDFKNQTDFEMNMQDRPKGIYIVKVFSGEQVFTSKIIKN